MKIFRHDLQLANPFGISRGTYSQQSICLVNIDGGWGEGCPSGFFKETGDSVAAELARVADSELPDLDYIGDVAAELDAMGAISGAAKAAVDIALHDRLGRKLGTPVYKLFGKRPVTRMVTSFTIGIDTLDEMMRKVDEADSYEILKIKLGRNLDNDIAVMREIRRAVGDKVLRVDANCGWTLDEARRALPVMADLGVEYVEQPLAKGAVAQMKELKKGAPLPLFLDEETLTCAGLPELVGAADGINIKLMKCGGIAEGKRMIDAARMFGMQTMLGCRIESCVGISAAAHLAPMVDHLDLDGNLLVKNDPFDGVQVTPAGELILSDKPGLGVAPKSQFAAMFAGA